MNWLCMTRYRSGSAFFVYACLRCRQHILSGAVCTSFREVNRLKITVNGKPLVLTAPMTISDFIESHQLNPATIVIEFNGAIVASDGWPSLIMQENDKMEIITFVGGG